MSDEEEIQTIAAAAMMEFVNKRLGEADKVAKDIEKQESFQAKRDAHAAAFEAVKAKIEPTFPLLEKVSLISYVRGFMLLFMKFLQQCFQTAQNLP